MEALLVIAGLLGLSLLIDFEEWADFARWVGRKLSRPKKARCLAYAGLCREECCEPEVDPVQALQGRLIGDAVGGYITREESFDQQVDEWWKESIRETDEFIFRIDRELGGIEWAKITLKDPPPPTGTPTPRIPDEAYAEAARVETAYQEAILAEIHAFGQVAPIRTYVPGGPV